MSSRSEGQLVLTADAGEAGCGVQRQGTKGPKD